MEIINELFGQSKLVLTGIFIAFISNIIYRITPSGFVCIGRYRTKEGAIAIYLFSAVILGFCTPIIYQLSSLIITYMPIISIIGFIIILANYIINQSVPSWKHTSLKALLIYFVSILLIFLGFIVNLN